MELTSAIPGRLETINTFKDDGGSVAAVFPIHYPRALLRAFDILPVEVWGPPGVDPSQGASQLQPYICSLVHNMLAFLKTGGLKITDYLIVPHTCDSLQGFGSILIDFVSPRQPVIPIYIPRGRRDSDVDFFAAEFAAIYTRLQEITSRSPSDEEIMGCILREEQADMLLAKLHKQRDGLPFSDLQYYRFIRTREYLPAENFSQLAQETLSQAGESQRNSGIPIILSGIVPEPMSLFETITDLGGMVVADDLAGCGRRLYPTGKSEEPFQRMAESIIHAPPDPTRGNSLQERLDHLLNLQNISGAKGVVFYNIKFCEPELFDLPILRKGLREAGVPSIPIEVDVNDPFSQQTITRLEAFLETIE